MICKNCGVELEDDMLTCPLCGTVVNSGAPANIHIPAYGKQTMVIKR